MRRSMSHLFLHRIFLLMLLSALSSKAVGNQEEWWFAAQGSLLDFDYREYGDQGSLLDKESGILPGLILEIGKSKGQWRLSGKLSGHAGGVTYSGQTNGGVPISTVTKQQITDVGLRAEYSFENTPRIIKGIYFSAAQHYWRRDIQPTRTANGSPVAGLLEKYQWWQLNVGANVLLLRTERSQWMLDFSLMRISDPRISIYFSGLYDDASLALGERWGSRVSLPWRHSLGQSTTLLVEPYIERYKLGRSKSVPLSNHGFPIGTLFEPNSEYSNLGLAIGLRRDFK